MKHYDTLPAIPYPLLIRLNWLASSYGANNTNNFVVDNSCVGRVCIK